MCNGVEKMVKFVIKGQDAEQEPILHAWLEVDATGDLCLCGSNSSCGTGCFIAYISHDDGMLHILNQAGNLEAIKTDGTSIKVAGYRRIDD